MDKKIGQVFETDNYSKFVRLEGNRAVLASRVKKIVASINEIGFIKNPIIVNDKFEVIDGQGRLEAAQKLNLPVPYYVVEGASLRECVVMNSSNTKWKLEDYIDSYVELGNISYKYLKILKQKHPRASYNAIRVAVNGRVNILQTGGLDVKTIKNGKFNCTVEQFNAADKCLTYIDDFIDYIKSQKDKGRNDFWVSALVIAYGNENADLDRLKDKFLASSLVEIATIKGALEHIEKIYNYRISKANKVYFVNDYERQLDKR